MRYGTPHCDHFQIYASQNTAFFMAKIQDSDFTQKTQIFRGFSFVVSLNQGVQLKDRLF